MALDYEIVSDLPPTRRTLHVVAWLVALSVFPLIWMGGLVTSHGVGLSVPDWPNSYGYNMFLFPPSKWLGGIFFEHTHRLLGTISGLLSVLLVFTAWGPARHVPVRRGLAIATVVLWTMTIVGTLLTVLATRGEWFADATTRLLPHLCVGLGSLTVVVMMAWLCRRREPRRWVRWLTIASLTAVCIQGMLGGMRVDLVSKNLAILHGCFAQAFFCLAAFQVLVTSRWWQTASDRSLDDASPLGRQALTLAGITFAIIYCQLVAGALMRHNGAGLAIPDLPLAYGHLLPPTNQEAMDAANAARMWQFELPPVSLTQVWLHFAHRCGAILVSGCVITTAVYVFQKLGPACAAGRVAAILLGLLALQVTLGLATVAMRKPADLASMHVAVGALTLMTASQVVLVLARQFWRVPERRAAATPAGRLVGV